MKKAAGLLAVGLALGVLSQSCGSSDDKEPAQPLPEGGEAGQAAEPRPSDSGGMSGSAGDNNGGMSAAAGDGSGSGGNAGDAGVGGSAVAADCRAGYAECDEHLSEPCETNLNNVDSCGACDVRCRNPHGTISCDELACKVTSCTVGWGDCNGNPNDGCETALLENDQHCGACGRDCTSAGVTCTVDSCGVIRMQENLSLGTGNGPLNDRSFAFSPSVGIVNMTRVNSVLQRFDVDGVSSNVIWDAGSDQSGSDTLVIDAQDVVWAQNGSQSVVRKKLATAPPTTVPTDLFFPEAMPVYLRLQGDYFYWISGENGNPGHVYRRLRTAPAEDGGTKIVTAPQGSSSELSGFAVTSDAIYWVTANDGNAATTDNDVRMVPLAGGTPVSVPKVADAPDATIQDFGNATISPSLTAVGDTLYFARTIGASPLNGVYRYKPGDTAPTKVVEAEDVSSFAVGDAWLYFGKLNQQGVWRAPLEGGQAVEVVQADQTTIVGVDEQFAYIAVVNTSGYLYKIFQ